jgi:hypothetical protein
MPAQEDEPSLCVCAEQPVQFGRDDQRDPEPHQFWSIILTGGKAKKVDLEWYRQRCAIFGGIQSKVSFKCREVSQ